MRALTKPSPAVLLPTRWVSGAVAAVLLAWGALVGAQAAELGTPADPSFSTYWQRHREGWFWYVDPEPVVPALPPPAIPKPVPAAAPDAAGQVTPVTPRTPQDRDLADFEAFRRNVERALNAATQNPSEANVAQFLELYAAARRKASTLSDVAQALAVRMPWLDETSGGARPHLPTAQRMYDSLRMQERDQQLREMADSWGLFFFFRGNCGYCHVQAPLLRQFQQRYGFTVHAVSLDGTTLPDYPKAVRDNGQAQQVADALGVPAQHFVVPALVLARPATRDVLPVGFGAMHMEDIAERIAFAVRLREDGPGRASSRLVSTLTGAAPANRSAFAPALAPAVAPVLAPALP